MRVWHLARGEPVGEPLRGHDGAVSAVALGQVEGRTVAVTGGADGTVRVWDLADREPVGEPLRGHDERVAAVALGQVEGRALAVTGGEDDTGRVWDLADGEPLGEPLRGYDGWVTAVALGQVEGRTMAVTGSPDGAVRPRPKHRPRWSKRWRCCTRPPISDKGPAPAADNQASPVASSTGAGETWLTMPRIGMSKSVTETALSHRRW